MDIREQGVGIRAHLIWMLERRVKQMSEVDRRTWRYRKLESGSVEGVIFNSPEDVPDGEGWCRSPTGEPGPLDGVVEAVEAAPEPEADEGEAEAEPEDEKDRIKQLRAMLKGKGVKLPPRTSMEWLNNKIAELENADA